ncbi:MAG: ATP-binding protein [Bacteroidetes bacterium]|nr:ATP-binding protein [Bacteroidota bacterium]
MELADLPDNKFRLHWKQFMFVFLLVAGLFAGGHFYYHSQKDDILKIHKEFLSAISSFKVHEINNWIEERKAEGAYIASSPEFISHFVKLLKAPEGLENRQAIHNWLEPIRRNHDYSNIVLFDSNGRRVFNLVGNNDGPWADGLTKAEKSHLIPGKVILSDVRKFRDGKLYLTSSTVLAQNGVFLGYAVFFIDPSGNLFPTLASWPVKRITAENILLHHDARSTFYLSGSRINPDTIIAFKTPSPVDEICKTIPLSGSLMLSDSKDYRGMPVLAELRHIEGTNWWIICKIDKSELTAPLQKSALNLVLYIAIFVLVITISAALIWKNQQLEHYRSRFKFQQKSQMDEEQIRYMNALLQEISDAIITFDRDMIIQSWNKGAERIYGWKAEEVVGKFGGGSLRVDFPGAGRAGIFEELAQKGTWKGELVHKRKDGSTAYILSSTSQLKDEQGNALGIITINKDISDVIQSEKVQGAVYRISELAHSAKDLNDLFANIHIVIGDLMDAHNLFIALVEQDGKTISFPYFIDEKDPPPAPRKRGNTLTDIVLRTGKHLLAKPEDIQYFVDRGIIETKGTLAIDWLGVPLKIDKDVIGVMVVQSYNPKIRYGDHEVDVLIFVSEQIALSIQRMKMQQELVVQKQKAEVSSKLTSSLLANMNHELRTPMNGILGFAEILTNDLLDPEARAKAENILISGRRLMDTLDAIMDLSHLESDKVNRKFLPLSIKKSLLKVLSNYEPLINRKNLRLNLNVPAFMQILADDYLLQHLLRCLIDNAVKYTEEGSITIEATELRESGKDSIAISVKDTGIGIAEENFDLIFETFRQVSEGYGRKFEGSGLGLSISRKIAILLNGEIRLKSKIGEGSEFVVILPSAGIPFEQVPAPVTEKVAEKHAPTSGSINYPAVLVVEDNLVNLQLLTLYIQDTCMAYSALDAKAAIESSRQKHFDLILMDINLGPGLDGIQAMLEIRKLTEYKNVPIVALTGYASIGDRDRLISLGFSGYLPKPVTKDVLLGLIDEMIRA